MGPVIKLLQAIRGLTKSGGIKSLDDAYRLAQRELGETFSRYQNQIKDAFNQGQKEITKITNKPTADIIPFRKKEGIESLSKGKVKDKGEVIEASFKPGVDKRGKRVEESPSQASGTIMDRISKASNRIEELMKEQEAMYKPKQGLQLAEGLTRTIARKILDRKNIEIPKGRDPIGVFSETFGDSIGDVNNLAEELIEIDRRGGGSKNIDEMIEMEGLFDIEVPKNPSKGMTDKEVMKLIDETEGEDMMPKMTERFKLRQKYPGIDDELLTQIVDDPNPQNKAEALATLDQAMKLVEEGKGTDEVISILQRLKKTRKDNAEGGINTLMASDNMNERLLEKLYEDFLEQGFSPEEASRKAREAFNERVNVANGGGLQYLMGM